MNDKAPSVVLVTYSSELALALAKQLVNRGVHPVFPVSEQQYVDKGRETTGARAIPIVADIRESESVEACIRVAESNFGSVVGFCYVLPRLAPELFSLDWNNFSLDPLNHLYALFNAYVQAHAALVKWLTHNSRPNFAIIDVIFRQPTSLTAGASVDSMYCSAVEGFVRALTEIGLTHQFRVYLLRLYSADRLVDQDPNGLTLTVGDIATVISFLLSGTGRFLRSQVVEVDDLTRFRLGPENADLTNKARRQSAKPFVVQQARKDKPPAGLALWRALGRAWGKMQRKSS